MMKNITGRTLTCVLAITVAVTAITGCAHKAAPKTDVAAQSSVGTTRESSSATEDVARKKEAVEEKAPTGIASPSAAEEDAEHKQKMKGSAELGLLLETIYFNYDSASLSAEAREAAHRNFRVLSNNADVKVRIEGHCDERGSDEYNLALGERRADAAMKYLRTLGIEEDRLSTISYGKERPAVEGTNEEAWAKNRRVEVVIGQ